MSPPGRPPPFRRIQVDDADAWVLATVEQKFGGSVHMKRLHAPDGVPLELAVSDADFEKLTPATGNPEVPVPDLVALMDVNTGAVLHKISNGIAVTVLEKSVVLPAQA